MKRYSEETIQNACYLLKKGVSIRRIMKETGIKSHIVIYWHCSPEKRKTQEKRIKQWMTENRERWLAICKKASNKYWKKVAK